MTIKKKLVKNFIVQNILGLLGFIYICIVKITSQINHKNKSIPEYFWKNKKPFILAFWHNQLLMISFSWKKNKKLNILASGHSDGQFGAIIAKYLGSNTLTVSAKKRKVNIRPIFDLLNNNNYIGITPDGPRGPKEKVSDGVIKIAKKSNVPIVPVGFWSSRNFTLNSWDSFLITYPFSKCVFAWSEPILIPNNLRDEEIPKFQLLLENKINDCIQSAKLDLSV